VHIRDASGSPNQQLDLRGFGITGDQNTLVLLDGLRLSPIDLSSPNLSSIPLESIERIEILAGGGGVAYGSGTTGGTINIVTRAPKPGTQSGSVFAGGGSLGTYDLRGSASASGEQPGLGMYANAYDTNNNTATTTSSTRSTCSATALRARSWRAVAEIRRQRPEPRPARRADGGGDRANPRQTLTLNNYSTLKGAFAAPWELHEARSVQLAADLAYRGSTAEAFDGFFPISSR
jgi:iron complex outermembrane receptor protein